MKKSTNKIIFGNRDVVSSVISRRNIGTVDSSNNDRNSKASGRRISGKHVG